jgi:hypothetical protein
MSYFIKWLDVTLSPTKRHQQQWTNLFCRFGVPRETHDDQGNNFESQLMQDMLEYLGISKTQKEL